MGTIGIDVATSQRNLNFWAAANQGLSSCYVKLGGDNVGRYVAPYYAAQVDAARNATMRVGHYWVPNSDYNPIGAADYFVDNLRGWTGNDFVVLDNESLDGASRYSDAQAAAWLSRVGYRLNIGGFQLKCYIGLSDARSNDWPQLLNTGCDFIIAAYGYAPFTYDLRGKIPSSRNNGHQYSSSGNVGGVTIDLNSWRDGAFNYQQGGGAMALEVPGDLIKILTASFDNTVLGGGNIRTVQNALGAIFWYGDLINGHVYDLRDKIDALNAKIDGLKTQVNLTPEQVAQIAAAVPKVDLPAIAKAVNDDAAKRLHD